jgi:hypothetical protein
VWLRRVKRGIYAEAMALLESAGGRAANPQEMARLLLKKAACCFESENARREELILEALALMTPNDPEVLAAQKALAEARTRLERCAAKSSKKNKNKIRWREELILEALAMMTPMCWPCRRRSPRRGLGSRGGPHSRGSWGYGRYRENL